ncbi:MAG: TRAP transporter small permease subunit [Pseudomonadota bacterium]
MNFLADILDNTNRILGRILAWLVIFMVLVQFGVVVARYVFGVGDLWAQESIIYMHGTLFMLAAAYTLSEDAHVRVDIFYRAASDRYRAFVNLFGSVFLLIPVAMVLTLASWSYVGNSWRIFEKSMESSGIPGVFLLKTAIPVFAILVAAQGVVMALRSLRTLGGLRLMNVVGGLLIVVPVGAIMAWFFGENLSDKSDLLAFSPTDPATLVASILTVFLPVVGWLLIGLGVLMAVRADRAAPTSATQS